jgi:hypothetical protein
MFQRPKSLGMVPPAMLFQLRTEQPVLVAFPQHLWQGLWRKSRFQARDALIHATRTEAS